MVRPGAQAQAQVIIAIVVGQDRAAFGVEGEGIDLLLLVGFRALGRDIDQDPFQGGLGLTHLAQGQERGLAAFNAADGGIHHPHLVAGQVAALLAEALVGVVHHQATRLFQARAQDAFTDEFGDAHGLIPRIMALFHATNAWGFR